MEIWLRSRNHELSGRRPIDVLRGGELAPVLEAVERLERGSMG